MKRIASFKPRPFRKHILALAAAGVLALGVAQPAHALFGIGDIVFDPSNYAENVLTAARTLEQINNQIRQLQNEAQMLVNQARNLTSLPFSALADLRATLDATNQLIRQAQGLAFNVSQMEADFRRLYPDSYSAAISGTQMALDARTRWTNSLEALRTATQVQSQAVQNFAADERTLTDLVNRSQSAVGALQAMQVTNQLLALQSRQAMQAQQLQITQDRAAALEQARQVAVQERAREVRRRFLGTGTPYTPYRVNSMATREAGMRRAWAVAIMLLLAACGKPAPIESVDSLVDNPARLKELRAACKADHVRVGDAQCNAVAEATRRRFLRPTPSPYANDPVKPPPPPASPSAPREGAP